MTEGKNLGQAGFEMREDIDAVIFDLDGSLVDSMWIWSDIDIEYLGRYGLKVPPRLMRDVEGLGFSETAAYFKRRFSLPDSVEEIKRAWNEMALDRYLHDVPLKPGAALFLDHCRKNGIKLAIATSNSRLLVEQIVDVHGLRDYFSCIITACDVGRGKPAPDIYLEAALQLNVPCSRCLVFEDVPAGILAGKAAGMAVCAVEDASSREQEEEKRRLSDFYIRDYYGLKLRG